MSLDGEPQGQKLFAKLMTVVAVLAVVALAVALNSDKVIGPKIRNSISASRFPSLKFGAGVAGAIGNPHEGVEVPGQENRQAPERLPGQTDEFPEDLERMKAFWRGVQSATGKDDASAANRENHMNNIHTIIDDLIDGPTSVIDYEQGSYPTAVVMGCLDALAPQLSEVVIETGNENVVQNDAAFCAEILSEQGVPCWTITYDIDYEYTLDGNPHTTGTCTFEGVFVETDQPNGEPVLEQIQGEFHGAEFLPDIMNTCVIGGLKMLLDVEARPEIAIPLMVIGGQIGVTFGWIVKKFFTKK